MPTSTTLRSDLIGLSINKLIRGFTLVGLIITITIILILTAIGIIMYWGIQKTARDSARKSDLYTMSRLMEVYYSEGGLSEYIPLTRSMFTNGIPRDPSMGSNTCQGNPCKYCFKTFEEGNCTPGDPVIEDGTPPGGMGFIICANLESGTPTFLCRRNQR